MGGQTSKDQKLEKQKKNSTKNLFHCSFLNHKHHCFYPYTTGRQIVAHGPDIDLGRILSLHPVHKIFF
jgi:hypothetical protein